MTWLNPPGWAALTEGCPATTVASNVFSSIPAGTRKVWTKITHGYEVDTFGVRIIAVSNGAVLATKQDVYYNMYNLQNVSITHPGGDIRVEVYASSSFAGTNIFKAGSTVELAGDTFSMGMNNTGRQAIYGTADRTVVAWTTRPGFTSTVITSDKLVARGQITAGAVTREGSADLAGRPVRGGHDGRTDARCIDGRRHRHDLVRWHHDGCHHGHHRRIRVGGRLQRLDAGPQDGRHVFVRVLDEHVPVLPVANGPTTAPTLPRAGVFVVFQGTPR